MAVESLHFPDPPTDLDLEDGGQAYNMGIRFQVTEECPCPGVRWVKVPASVSVPPGGAHVASIWDESDSRLAAASFVPVPGADDQDVAFAAPFTLVPGVNYIAAIYTVHYVFRASGGVYPTSPSGKIVSDLGRLVAYNGGPDDEPASSPSGSSSGLFYISPLTGSFDEDPHDTTGTAGALLGASAAVATSRLTSGTVALTATATAARTTSRTTAARAELAAGASVVRSSARTTSGSARVLLDARGTQVRSGGGPRLVTVGRASWLTSVTRPDAISTSTRG